MLRQKVAHREESAAAQAQYVETLRAQMGGGRERLSALHEERAWLQTVTVTKLEMCQKGQMCITG